MMFFTTPIVFMYVTPSMLNLDARLAATSKSHFMSSGESVSMALLFVFGHSTSCA